MRKQRKISKHKKQVCETFLFQPFEDLKRTLEQKGLKITPDPRRLPDETSPTDEALFAEAMKEVREIMEFRRLPVRPDKDTIRPGKIFADNEGLRALEELVSGRGALNLPDTQEYVEWTDCGFRRPIAKKLHEGQFSVQDFLDLHGLCVDEAEAAVGQFLKESLARGHRCVKIIHGRGLRSPKGPVLKGALIKWLSGRYRKNIIAFVTARQCDGGLGALYVLLR
jgi:DNA-nicking Smr family endonuclease